MTEILTRQPCAHSRVEEGQVWSRAASAGPTPGCGLAQHGPDRTTWFVLVQLGSDWTLLGMAAARHACQVDVIKRVRAARGAVNMSLDDFAAAIGVGRQTLIRIENGTRTPRDHEYEQMAAASGLPLGFFYEEDLVDALGGRAALRMSDQLERQAEELSELREALASLSTDVLRLGTELEEHRVAGHPRAQGEDAEQ